MCAVYDICEACDVDHSYEQPSVCRWPLTSTALFYLNMPPDHPFVSDGLQLVEDEIQILMHWMRRNVYRRRSYAKYG